MTGRFAPRRLATFSSGRVAARRALGADVAIPVLDGGAPGAPEGWRLSISHTDEVALAVACRDDVAAGVGVDIETCARMDLAWRRLIVGPLDRVPEGDVLKLTATFSLRESLFKALGGRVREGGYVRWDGEGVEVGVEGMDLALSWGWTLAGACVISWCVLGWPQTPPSSPPPSPSAPRPSGPPR